MTAFPAPQQRTDPADDGVLWCPAGPELTVSATATPAGPTISLAGWSVSPAEARRLARILTALADLDDDVDTPTGHDWAPPRSPQRWARRMCAPGAAVILDTETTDLHGAVIEVAVIDAATGDTLLDTLVDPGPEVDFAPSAVAVHGLTAAVVAGAPTWAQVVPQLLEVTAGRTVLAYNARYDHAVIAADCARHGLDPNHLADRDQWGCILEARRVLAADGTGMALDGGHRALADTHAARECLRALADTWRPLAPVPHHSA